MHTFFYGWRRKTGIVTLILALLFVGCWIRCFYVENWLFLNVGNKCYFLRSDRGGFSCNRWDRPLPPGVPLWGSQPVMHITIIGTGAVASDDFFVYYAGLTATLTLLSTYLLLCTPRYRQATVAQAAESNLST